MKKSVALVMGAFVLTLGLSACGAAEQSATLVPTTAEGATVPATPVPDVPSSDPTLGVSSAAPALGTDAAVAWEALMSPDGEYAASASYAAVIEKFGAVEPYVSIREGEERHIAALVRQLSRMGVTAPANPYLGNVQAPADLEAAAQAWAEGEVLNVEMYDALLKQTTDANLVRVLTNLRRASLEEHLPMFEAAADAGGTLTLAQMAALGH